MGHKWNYSEVEYSTHGSMVCTKCKHPIRNGEYRYRETTNAYLSQHRHCSTEDTAWIKMEKEREKAKVADMKKLKAYKAFRERWDESALDEEIESMKRLVRR